METNTNSPEANNAASAGCHPTPCSACGFDRMALETSAQSAVHALVRDNERLRDRAAKAESNFLKLTLGIDAVRDRPSPYDFSMLPIMLGDGTRCDLKIWVCDSKETVQKLVTEWNGFLPSDLTDAASVEGGDGEMLCALVWVRCDSSPARVAHEAYHAVSMLLVKMGIDPNDYTLIDAQIGDHEFAYMPAEVAAHLMEAIVDEVLIHQRNFYLPNVDGDGRREPAPPHH